MNLTRKENGVATLPGRDFVQSQTNANLLYTIKHHLGPQEDFYTTVNGVELLWTITRGAWEGGVQFVEYRPADWMTYSSGTLARRIRFYRTVYGEA